MSLGRMKSYGYTDIDGYERRVEKRTKGEIDVTLFIANIDPTLLNTSLEFFARVSNAKALVIAISSVLHSSYFVSNFNITD